jgi:RNA recognition motif-containing protein
MPRRRALSDFDLLPIAWDERLDQTQSIDAAICKDEASELSTCPSDDEFVSVSEYSSETEESWVSSMCLPPGVWPEAHAAYDQQRTRTTKRNGTERLNTAEVLPDGTRTTIVLRNLPQTWLRGDVVSFLDSHGFHARFDFAYLPRNFKKSQAFGFALVNFPAAADAQQALMALNYFMLDGQPVLAEWSEVIQGTEALVERYRNSAVMRDMDELHRPMLLRHGRMVSFPKPTKSVEALAEHMQCPAEAEQAPPECSPRTTLAVRKLGKSSSVESFRELLDQAGFATQYDFVYVPRHFTKGSSFGFAILNFVNDVLASEALDKIAMGALSANGETLTAEWSDGPQGLSALIAKYRDNRVMEEGMPESFRPVVLSEGVPIAYPRIN